MKCVKCGGEMVEGITQDGYGDDGTYNQPTSWAKSITKVLGIFQGKSEEERQIATYRCTACGYLESYAK
jgi:DNA-directed RNA polymerase subunit RPC12/RpoP